MTLPARAQIGPDVIHVAYLLKQNATADELRTTHHGLLSLALALGKGEVHRDRNAHSGRLTMRTVDFKDLIALAGIEFISTRANLRNAMSVAEYHLRFDEDLTVVQREAVAARVFELEHSKLIGSVAYDQSRGILTARIPLANVWVMEILDGISSVKTPGADAAARVLCEPEIL